MDKPNKPWVALPMASPDDNPPPTVQYDAPILPTVMAEEIEKHPPTDQCPDQECWICGARDCPFHEPLHYHHDGCPICFPIIHEIYAAIISTPSLRVRERWVEKMAGNVFTALIAKGLIHA